MVVVVAVAVVVVFTYLVQLHIMCVHFNLIHQNFSVFIEKNNERAIHFTIIITTACNIHFSAQRYIWTNEVVQHLFID